MHLQYSCGASLPVFSSGDERESYKACYVISKRDRLLQSYVGKETVDEYCSKETSLQLARAARNRSVMVRVRDPRRAKLSTNLLKLIRPL